MAKEYLELGPQIIDKNFIFLIEIWLLIAL